MKQTINRERREWLFTAAALGGTCLAGCAATAPLLSATTTTLESTMSIEHVAAVQAIYQAFGKGDIAAIQARVADNTHWDFAGARTEIPWHRPVNRRAEVADFLGAFGSQTEVTRFEPREFIHSGKHVIVEVRLEYKVRATGRLVAQDQLHWWTFDADNKVLRLRHFEDTAQVLAAVKG